MSCFSSSELRCELCGFPFAGLGLLGYTNETHTRITGGYQESHRCQHPPLQRPALQLHETPAIHGKTGAVSMRRNVKHRHGGPGVQSYIRSSFPESSCWTKGLFWLLSPCLLPSPFLPVQTHLYTFPTGRDCAHFSRSWTTTVLAPPIPVSPLETHQVPSGHIP